MTAILRQSPLRARWTALAAVSLAAACGASEEAEPIVNEAVWHMETNATEVVGDIERAAADYALSSELDLGVASEDDFVALSVTTAPDTLRHVRLQQVHRDVPVRGSQLLVHADDSTFLGLSGTVTKNLGGFPVEPAVASADAVTAAKADHAATTSATGAIVYENEASSLVIVPRTKTGADLAWHIEFFTPPQDGVEIGRWEYFVNADSGDVLFSFNGLHTLEQASGAGGNAKKARAWSAELDVEADGAEFIMETERLVTVDMENKTDGEGEDVVGPIDDIGDAPINDAHGYAEITLNMMRDWVGFDSIDDAGFVIRSRVHYAEGYENAFWDGQQMTYGDGADTFHPLSGALDVVAHEVSHGFTSFHSNLIYAGMPGGLNESFSDIAGTMAEFYDEGDGADWLLGEDIFKAADGALRYMCDPSLDSVSLDDAGDFDPAVDVHYSSGIANRAFCLAVARISGASGQGSSVADAVRRVGTAWYTANAGYWPSSATFKQGCQGTVDAARAIGFTKTEVAHISQSWEDVGVLCGGNALVCDDDGTCDVEAGETCASCSSDCGSCSEDCGFFKRVKCRIGLGDCSRCDLPEGCGDGFCTADEDDTTCAQDCGCAAEGGLCGTVAPFGCWCDPDCEARGDCCADVEDACF